ncbi:hypothetical protein JW887_02565 [Candidatus Dojkabacteria bacterium]|nr:hypothetical protein [Candidatus Dojkabacteria bacterium]
MKNNTTNTTEKLTLWQKIKKLFQNRYIVFSFIIFNLLTILDTITVLYVLVAESNVYFMYSAGNTSAITAIITALITTAIVNLIIIALSFTRLRTTTLIVPFILGSIFFVTTFIYGSSMLLYTMPMIIVGVIIGIYYSLIFYGPAIWFYYRLKMPLVSVGWLSVFYLSTLLIANAYKIDQAGAEAFLALLRPDYLLLTGSFYLITSLLLVVDHAQELARWKRTPEKTIKFPLKTLIPAFLVLIIVTVITNFLSPAIWKVLWKKTETENTDDPEKLEKEDVPNGEDGPSGNQKQNDDSIQMDPNQNLQGEVNMDNSGKIMFIVNIQKTDEYGNSLSFENTRHYWKMDDLESYSEKNGFYNNMEYQEYDYAHNLYSDSWFSYFPTSYPVYSFQEVQIYTFLDMETNWIINEESPNKIRLLSGDERSFYMFENKTAVLEKNKPWKKDDSYEIQSSISEFDYTNPDTYDQFRDDWYYYEEYATNDWDEIIDQNTGFDDPEITALAKEITEPYDNKLDKSIAVMQYLQDNYKYTLKPGDPTDLDKDKENIERLKYFLFEDKEGYCLHFATAMTAMLRSQDIPARVTVGFAEGTYDYDLNSYVVASGDAHAWVEVFFDDYGWLTFDPTPASDPEAEDKEKEKEKELDKELTDEKKKELEKMQKEALDKLDEFNNYDYIEYDPNKESSPEWIQNINKEIEKQIKPIAQTMQFMIPLAMFLAILSIIVGPPAINTYIDLNLSGKIKKRDDREQIIAYFKLIERKLRQYKHEYGRKRGETSLEYYDRLKKTNIVHKDIDENFQKACNIYNRAAFRFEIKPTDRKEMSNQAFIISDFVEHQMSDFQNIIKLWVIW